MIDTKTALVSLTVLGLLACGATPPPRELVNARSAYQRAASGPAVELAPAPLDTAKQALVRAEDEFREEGDTQEARDYAYIARRKAEQAEASAGVEGATRQQKQADKDFKKLQSQLTDAQRAELDAARRELETARHKAAQERAEAAAKLDAAETAKKYMADEAARAKAEAAKSKEQLELERKAREAAEKKLASALASLAAVAKVKEEKRGVVITLDGSVLFASGKYELLPIARQRLDQVAKALKDQGYKKIVVEGHTDSRGSRQMNMELSFRRAESVRAHLIGQGIEVGKISAVGLGPDRPVADNKSAEGRANNRRVELIVTPP